MIRVYLLVHPATLAWLGLAHVIIFACHLQVDRSLTLAAACADEIAVVPGKRVTYNLAIACAGLSEAKHQNVQETKLSYA